MLPDRNENSWDLKTFTSFQDSKYVVPTDSHDMSELLAINSVSFHLLDTVFLTD
jgi:hypothetical protein